MHVADVAKVVFPARLDANTFLPGVHEVEDLLHDRARERGWALGKAADELVEELLGRDLEVERVPARLDEGLEQGEGEDGHVRVAVVDEAGDEHRGFARAEGGRERARG